jgi:hypothetical protein
MRRMLAVHSAALLTALVLGFGPAVATAATAPRVHVLEHGQVHVRADPLAGPPDAIRPTAADAADARASLPAPGAATAARGLTPATALEGMRRRHGIDAREYRHYATIYRNAQRAVRKLSGRPRKELQAVLGNLFATARAGKLTADRAPLAFLTVQRNREWWSTGESLGYGERVTFGESIVQWQSYPGQGIQVQWLGTFGKANAMWDGGPRYNMKLRTLLSEVLPLAVPRAGGIAWEYLFRFDGGAPGWVSAMAQGTAIQTYARAATRIDGRRAPYLKIAHRALGIFEHGRPDGIRDRTRMGTHFLMYSFSRTHILNGFVQALNGLHDYADVSGDKTAARLFAAGEADARREVPKFDTGSWSLYQLNPQKKSDPGYHALLRDFLQGLCDRLTDDRRKARNAGHDGGKLPSPTVYCRTAARFTSYMNVR